MAQQGKNQKWCVAAEIPQNVVFMMGSPTMAFFDLWPKMGLGGEIKEYFTWFKGDFSVMCYRRAEFDAEADFLAAKMLKNPRWALRLIKKTERWSREFFIKSKRQLTYDLSSLSDRELIKVYLLPAKEHFLSHGVGASVSWHADCDKERVTKALMKMVEARIKDKKLNLSASAVFSVLSTPFKISIVEREEIDFLRAAGKIWKNGKMRTAFIQSDLDYLAKELKRMDAKIWRIVYGHYKKYRWIPYQYKGPAYGLKDFLGRWQALLRDKQPPLKLLAGLRRRREGLLKEQRGLWKKLKFSSYQAALIRLSQALVHIKEFRKMALYHGMYCFEPIFREIGRRLGLSLAQVTAMNHWEIPEALSRGRYDADELNGRLKECAAYCDGRRYVVYTGTAYKKFMKKIKFEKIKIKNTNELRGTCACPGKAKGAVKIINVPEDMKKMNKGDILVAHNTNPNLVPAMKMAAALISEAGGLTCHAAIVARELKIPCLVGVAGAAKILKDGDMVEVDAAEGLAKKI